MKTILTLLLLLGPIAAAEHPAVEEARGPCDEAIRAANSRYRSAAADALRVYASHLDDAVRAAVRRVQRSKDLDGASRLDRVRREVVKQREDLLARSYPGGSCRVHGADAVTETYEECAAALKAAAERYRRDLAVATEPFMSALAHALLAAARAADLEAANRVRAEMDGVQDRIRERLKPMSSVAVSFAEPGAREQFVIGKPRFWRVEDGELVGLVRKDEGQLTAVFRRGYHRLATVTVRGRIVAHEKNFRMAVGPVNLILNWERRPECHFRYHEQLTVVERPLLTPGRFHEITVRQATETGIEILIDGEKVCDLEGKLHGTITFYPSNSAIGITDLHVEGVPWANRHAKEPSHRIW